MTTAKYKIDDNFIGVFDNFFHPDDINTYIKFFEQVKTLGYTRKRSNIGLVEDEDISLIANYSKNYLDEWVNFFNVSMPFNHIFYDKILPVYIEKYAVLAKMFTNLHVSDFKIQKSMPGEGYNAFHFETDMLRDSRRTLVFLLYLNDVEEGGETEFRYLKVRYKPKSNRLILFPAGFTHTHRGLPPLSNDKYIATGWIEHAVW
jgi:hypothetical protein